MLQARVGLLACPIGAAIAMLASGGHAPRLIWNMSDSAPIGLYYAHPVDRLLSGQWIIASLPSRLSVLAARRRYIGLGVPILKQIAAQTGDRVCAIGMMITVNGRFVTVRRSVDRVGRRLPRWSGCYRLTRKQIFLLNPKSSGSFDSRYFGPFPRDHLVAAVEPLWVWTTA